MRFRRRRKIYKKLYESPRQVLFLFFAVGFSITVLSFMFFSLLIPKDIMHDIMNDSIKKIFMIITGMAIGLSVIDIFMVLIRKKNLDAVVFELETNDKYIGFYKIIPFILLILAVLSIAVSRNSYLLWLSILMISFALSFAIRGLFFPVGLSEKGLMFFGEVYEIKDVLKCFINTENKKIMFVVWSTVFIPNSIKRIILKFPDVPVDDLVAFLNKKEIDIEYI
ncbi:MAG TPA: hypothetical protein DEF39_14320 [Hungateiclostridium thermocellum]|jgi:hypothetical protein|uniref:DUF5673 domain-containing protein n=4 Tax=Acetivibrio thermocellus TaxID=1515 RepID=A3DIU5_ACET2|nr:hypothetical protein Cthe_2675 [Acetivibrio thermocellus ATCC 27405]ADU73357.1 hypothetical protein Clo1313_0265 [Acetivibrio thermocellus DSM 1313]ALX07278.1 hypothetical protein AD2_00269 [Acetivibrio thermocellus AD2]ANV75016.1 hypothetical protein LQRI_0268 [Acetivibrio thermocellus DSM 2360]EIC04255.1 hypothetical protein YSBL_2130 [Acetivibrio thermocellus YS]THJ79410.1 hypothetical protein EPD62_01460 [Acetivibrio thermocellus]CDG37139.1 hypothetical protein CTHBC1_2551 [Acetivibrio